MITPPKLYKLYTEFFREHNTFIAKEKVLYLYAKYIAKFRMFMGYIIHTENELQNCDLDVSEDFISFYKYVEDDTYTRNYRLIHKAEQLPKILTKPTHGD
jgi:hypothetical protein